MNNMDMLELIGSVRDSYIEEAQRHRQPQKARRRSPWKVVLIAAAMALMLTGCAYAVMKLQDLKVGEDTFTKQRDVFGNLVEPTNLAEDVIYPYASAESPMQQAAKEWHNYRYGPDMPKDWDLELDESLPENYRYVYNCCTREMADKLEEIADKYGLKLLETNLVAQSYQKDILHDALGLESVVRSDAKAEVREHYGDCYPNGTFSSSVFFTLQGEDAWELESFADFYYAADGYFYPYYSFVTEECQVWNYQTADGTPVLMVMRPDGQGMVYANGIGGSIMIDLDPGRLSPNPYPRDENDLPTREDLEQMADLFDYKVKPHGFDAEAVKAKLDQREAEYQKKMAENNKPFEGYWALPECAGYAEYLNTLNFLENTSFALVDLNDDGVQDLFLETGGMNRAMTIRDGKVERLFEELGRALPCEDGYFMTSDLHYDIPGEVRYCKLAEGRLEYVEGFMFRDGIWRHGQADVDNGYSYPISDEDAQAIRDKYKLLDLDMHSCAEFPMNGKTLGEIVAAEPKPDEGELRRLYASFIKESDDWYMKQLEGVQYYALLDVTDDGEKDLILSQDGETICLLASHYRGRVIRRLGMNYRLREGNVLESTSVGLFDGVDGGSEITRHSLTQFRNNKGVDLGNYNFVRDTQSWVNAREEPIPASDYESLTEKYPLVSIDFKPIAELMAE